jgi:hypothetical protein
MPDDDDPYGDLARLRALNPYAPPPKPGSPPAFDFTPPPVRTLLDSTARSQAFPPSDPRPALKPVGPLHPDGWRAARSPQATAATEQPINFKPGMSLNTLIADGRELYGEAVDDPSASALPYLPPNAPLAVAKWLRRVWPRGEWDYKKEGPERYEGLGNYAYGVTGNVIGIPDPVLLRGAGLAQELFHLKKDATGRRPGYDPAWGHFWQDAPYGDDARDQVSIRKGVDDARAAITAERARRQGRPGEY